MTKKLRWTEPQQRHVETTLKLVDKAVQRVEYVLERGVRHTGPAGLTSSLHAETVRRARELFHRLREEAVDVYHRYGFHSKKLDLHRVLDAEASSLWEMLEDCRPERMQGYGPMDPETASVLEREVGRLLEIVYQLQDCLRRAEKKPSGAPGA
jgi:hypothetical protein